MADRQEEKELRGSIAEIMHDPTLTQAEKSRRVQAVMSQRWARQQQLASEAEAEEGADGAARTADELAAQPTWHDEAKGVLGCRHYARACKKRAACCGKFYTCRLCHDEAENHQINRYATDEILCMRCGTIQKVSNACVSEKCAGKPFARFFCPKCKFWDDDEKKNIYHCNACGLCRIGKGLGIDRTHCDGCGCCYPNESLANHVCRPSKLHSDCPVCRQFLFTSVRAVCFTRCGHAIHDECLRQMLRNNEFRCPTCLKSVSDMRATWRIYDRYIRTSPMPAEYAKLRANILCNDCGSKCDVAHHFIGHKCSACKSYNTTVVSVYEGAEVAHPELPDEEEDAEAPEEAGSEDEEEGSAEEPDDSEGEDEGDDEDDAGIAQAQATDGHEHEVQAQQQPDAGADTRTQDSAPEHNAGDAAP
eukprot:m51a1_g6753 hypothetical protein (419) ;mRNA; r:46613-48079